MPMNREDVSLNRPPDTRPTTPSPAPPPSWRELLAAVALFMAPGALIVGSLALVRSDGAAMLAGIAVAALTLAGAAGAGASIRRFRSWRATRAAWCPNRLRAALRPCASAPAR